MYVIPPLADGVCAASSSDDQETGMLDGRARGTNVPGASFGVVLL